MPGFIFEVKVGKITEVSLPVVQNVMPPGLPLSGFPERQILSPPPD
jgi:hypothetical protein